MKQALAETCRGVQGDTKMKPIIEAIKLLLERQQVITKLLMHIAGKSNIYDGVVSDCIKELGQCDKHWMSYKERYGR